MTAVYVSPHTDFKFHPQITQVGCYWHTGFHVEIYVVEGDQLAVVDTGVTDSPTRYLAPALAALGHRIEDVDLIINTHGHMDHSGGNNGLVRLSGAEVCVHEDDVEVTEDLDLQFEQYWSVGDKATSHPERLADSLAYFRMHAGGPTRVTRPLHDGERLDLGRGVELTVIHSPGHTLGSSCFLWEREGVLLTGDSVLGTERDLGGLPLIFYPDLYLRTLDRLEAVDLSCLCLAHHYGSLSLTHESVKWGGAGKQFVQESREIALLIQEAMSSAMLGGSLPFLQAARVATRSLQERLGLRLDPESGLAETHGVPALLAYWEAMTREAHTMEPAT